MTIRAFLPGSNPSACRVCNGSDCAEFCTPDHTEAACRLAEVIDRSLMGPPGHTEPHPEWYIEDATAIAEQVEEGDGWTLEHDPACLGEFFKVNGVEFYLDMNAEGFNTPVLAAEERARRAEEESWDDDGGEGVTS